MASIYTLPTIGNKWFLSNCCIHVSHSNINTTQTLIYWPVLFCKYTLSIFNNHSFAHTLQFFQYYYCLQPFLTSDFLILLLEISWIIGIPFISGFPFTPIKEDISWYISSPKFGKRSKYLTFTYDVLGRCLPYYFSYPSLSSKLFLSYYSRIFQII